MSIFLGRSWGQRWPWGRALRLAPLLQTVPPMYQFPVKLGRERRRCGVDSITVTELSSASPPRSHLPCVCPGEAAGLLSWTQSPPWTSQRQGHEHGRRSGLRSRVLLLGARCFLLLAELHPPHSAWFRKTLRAGRTGVITLRAGSTGVITLRAGRTGVITCVTAGRIQQVQLLRPRCELVGCLGRDSILCPQGPCCFSRLTGYRRARLQGCAARGSG